ncbi:MAG: putative DNA binding domain-containing protein, partial [Candidatus Omnitrophica bacterium]|nr:putative DNA binding domain-containing protein [Candidatus Omnitrophota bacterium]
NDVNNWGGGYIVIGISEKKEIPVLPPEGLSPAEIAKIQKELLGLSHKMRPEYFPIVDVTNYKGKDIVIIWVPGGTRRPYKAAVNLAKGAEYAYYIRRNATTKRATVTDERSLMKLANDVPFDDRINHKASLEDFNVRLIEEYLRDVKSSLVKEVSKMPLKDLCRRMNIVEGPDEFLKPKNIGLMLFCDEPQKFFPRTTIDVVRYKDEVGDDFDEKIFAGPVHEQVRAALKYIKDLVIVEYVHKVDGRAEADRFFNYPYEAIEESLVNAVYHRSYEEREPIEVRIYQDKIYIISYPGPLPPLGKDNINKPIVTPHRYRNSRLGDSLKELELTEGRCTGFPKIRRALKNNGSPPPVFETDADRTYFMVTLKINRRVKAMAAQITPQKAGKDEGVNGGVNEGVNLLFDYITKHPGQRVPSISQAISTAPKTIERWLKKLKKERKINFKGSAKTGGYYVK